MLVRDSVVRFFVIHRADDAGLRIGPAYGVDARQIAQRRISPVGSDRKPGLDGSTVLQLQRRRIRLEPDSRKGGVFKNR